MLIYKLGEEHAEGEVSAHGLRAARLRGPPTVRGHCTLSQRSLCQWFQHSQRQSGQAGTHSHKVERPRAYIGERVGGAAAWGA